MTREKDFQNFLVLLSTIAVGTPQRDKIDEDVIESYYVLLEDMPFDIVKINTINAVHKNGWFPMINEIRGESTNQLEEKAREEYAYIEQILKRFWFDELPESSLNTIERKLEEAGKSYLFPTLNLYGMEILSGENPSATRSQIVKILQIEGKRREQDQLAGPEQKRIEETNKMLEGIGKAG